MRFSAVIAIQLVLVFMASACAQSQRIRFSQVPPSSTGAPGGVVAPQSGAALGNPSLGYDPFAPPGAAPIVQPGVVQPGAGVPYGNPYGVQPVPGQVPYPGASPMGVQPYGVQPNAYPPQPYGAQPYGAQPYGAPAPYGQYPQQQGVFANPYYSQLSQDFCNCFEQGRYMRVIQEFHYRHTWLSGAEANEVSVHDAELGMTLNWPNFLGSGEPLQISPTFIFHFWDGPQPPSTGDLPSRAYSVFLASSWTTPRRLNFGGEIVTSLGLYSDFQTITNQSWRIKGTGLGWIRMTPNSTFKFGVSYYDRLDIKLLPVGGIFWQPSDRVELEIYFPTPKITYKLPQVGNTELNLYFYGDYGGDAWTVERTAGFSDQVDLVDYRVLGGIEFVGFRGFRGFFEGGYSFQRRLLYRVDPSENISLNDSVIVRAGFLF